MNYRASFCDPFEPGVIEIGDISADSVIDRFEKIPWAEYLTKMADAEQKDIHYSPSFEVENKDTKHGLSLSAVGDPGDYEFYVFYKRPKRVSSFFGLIKKMNDSYTTDKTGFTKQDALHCLQALLKNDAAYLAGRIGE